LSSQPASPDSRFLALRFAGQELTDFHLPDAQVSRFVELRGQGADRDRLCRELSLEGEVVDGLIRADDAWAVAHRIATGQEPMYPPPGPGERVADTRAGTAWVPLAALAAALVAALVYALLR
jgi:hypothetical protein